MISLLEVSPSQLVAWCLLAARAVEPNPFFEPAFVLAAARRAGAQRGALLVVERGGEWIACLPVQSRGAPPFGALQTWWHPYCFLGTPLVDRERVDEGIAGLLCAARDRNRFLALQLVGLDGPVTAAVDRAVAAEDLQVVHDRRFERACVVRRPGAPRLVLAAKDRRRRMRRLEEQLGEVVVRDRSGDPEAIEQFLDLEAAGWKGEIGTALASTPADAKFFREMCAGFAGAGRLRMLELGGDSPDPVAMYCDVGAGDAVFSFKIAFDARYRASGPGIELLTRVVEDFGERGGQRLLDSCADSDSDLANGLMPDRRELASRVIGPTGARSGLARRAASAASSMRRRREARADAHQTRHSPAG
jgi:CelD/BcsL family acetyltransferase involved in cellulose biosynthesis